MSTIAQLLKKVQAVNIELIASESIDNTKEVLKTKQRDQLFHGLDSTGKPINKKYQNNKYARVKNEMNPLPGLGVPDLKLTGSFYNEMFVDVRSSSFVLDSADQKSGNLQVKYGTNIFGLGPNAKKEYIKESLRPEFRKKIKVITGL